MAHKFPFVSTSFLLFIQILLFSCTQPVLQEPSLEPDPNYAPGAQAVFDPEASLKADSEDWYKDAVFYHLWIKSFYDSDGDGVGDIRGIIEKLDYLSADLGVTALWLSPHMANRSELPNLHGYDVTDHYRVDPRFGTNQDMKDLLIAAHTRGMRVIFDYIPNHVSRDHPWFQDALNWRDGKRGWFRFSRSRPGGWTGFDSSSDWHPASSGGYYYGIFWDGMPDLNYRHPDVIKEMSNVVKYWLDFGFDGLRADAVRYLYEREGGTGIRTDYQDLPETLEFYRNLRTGIIDPYTEKGYAKFTVAENWNEDPQGIPFYLGTPEAPAFHETLDFVGAGRMLRKTFDPLATGLDEWWTGTAAAPPVGWYGSFLSNHDNFASRPGTLFSQSPGLQKVAAGMLLTGVGTPFIYYGNEIGMEGRAGNDINLRQAFNWSAAASQGTDSQSILGAHKALITARKDLEPLRRGTSKPLDLTDPGLSARLRTSGNRTLLVVHNHTGTAKPLSSLPGDYRNWRTVADTGSSGEISPWATKVLEE